MEQSQPQNTTAETNQTIPEWIKQEAQKQEEQNDFERLPALQFEEGKLVFFKVDLSEPFKEWKDETSKPIIVKKIIQVIHGTEKKNLWLNVKNPLYRQLVQACANGQTDFKVLRTGDQKNTRYTIVKD